MKTLYIIIFVFISGCNTSTNTDKQETQAQEEPTVKNSIDNASKITLEKELFGSWILLLKQADTSSFEIINPCNGSAGIIDFGTEVSISSGQDAMIFSLFSFTRGMIQVIGTDKQEYSINYRLTDDANYIDIIPDDDFPTSQLFGNFERVSFDSLLTYTGTKDTLHFVKKPENWREFFAEKGINQVFLPCDEDLFDEY